MINGEQMTLDLFAPDFSFGKTCRDHFQAQAEKTQAKTSASSSKKLPKSQTKQFLFLDLRRENGKTQERSWETDIQSLGGLRIINFGEHPKEDVESHLSQILEANPHPKYYLSDKACNGVIIRAVRRDQQKGKSNFPEELRIALQEQADWLKANPNALKDAIKWYEDHIELYSERNGGGVHF